MIKKENRHHRLAYGLTIGILAVCMALTLLPTAALAENGAGIQNYSDLSDAFQNANSTDPAAPTVIKISSDFALTDSITLPESKCIKLTSADGSACTLTRTSNKAFFNSTGGSTLILENITLDGSSQSEVLVDVYAGHLVIENGAVLQNSASRAIDVSVSNKDNANSTTSVVMNGGKICNNTGGGIYMNITFMTGSVQQALSVTINGGEITGNGTETGSCGGIYAREMVDKATAQVTIAGGEISGNKAKVGGGIFVDCPFTMTAGTITDNTAKTYGGGIYFCEKQQPSITGGEIFDNNASGDDWSPDKGKGWNVSTRSNLTLGGSVNIPDGIFLYGGSSASPDEAVLLLTGELENAIDIEGTYRVNPKPMVNLPVVKMADNVSLTPNILDKISLTGMPQFRLIPDEESNMVRLGNAASGQPLVFYSEYFNVEKFCGTAPSQSGEGWDWNKETLTLTLSGANVSTTCNYALELPANAKIVLAEDTVSTFAKTGNFYTVLGQGPLDISGPGTLVISADIVGLSAEGPITIHDCTLKTVGNCSSGGIYGYDDMTISGCEVDIKGGIVIENDAEKTLTIRDTAGTLDGGDYSAVAVQMPQNGTLEDHIKLEGVQINGFHLQQGNTGSMYYATVADASDQEVTKLILTRPANIYTITFDAGGGSVTPTSAQTGADGKLASLPTPTRSGNYTFLGWFTDPVNGTAVAADTVFTGSAAIYAHWRYNGGGGSGDSGSSSDNTTATDENSDGSTTTKTTDERTGTITETTKAADGTITVVVTQKDGSITETVTKPNGTKTETITTPEGSQTYAESRADGTRIRVDIPKSGEAAAAVDLPGGMTSTVIAFPVTDGTVVLHLLPDGTTEPVPFSLVTNGIVYVLLEDDADLRVTTRKNLFDDMSGHWAEEAADFTGARELFAGTSFRTFAPEEPMTRAMLTTVLYRLAGRPEVNGTSFNDVAAEQWYADSISWAVENQIAYGTASGMFSPDRAVSRQELAVILWNYAKTIGVETAAADNTSLSFKDTDQAEVWARPALQWASSSGILQGDDNGLLNPADPATRAEVAAILERFIRITIEQLSH